ncbi:hypothetical protein [Phenylobacterium sp.]|uniref:hypothetical protein n=1 Tax=Phenylobacterium sp. TaxID=1871053 RepID=UPI002737090A|nr:hypothetical protein [Phenylobacterium sp.]MDP3853123.1 hypothetical protein [Phenylobacterium sp.]
MRIPPPNPLTTTCTWIAAVFIAVREGAASTTSLEWLAEAMSGWWSYLPLAVLSLAAVVYLARLALPSKERPAKAPEASPEPASQRRTGVLMDEGGLAEGFVVTGQDVGVHMKRGGTMRNAIIFGGDSGIVLGDRPKEEDT